MCKFHRLCFLLTVVSKLFFLNSVNAQLFSFEPSTGKPNIAIPLVSLNAEGLQIPIDLVYNPEAIKIDELPDIVGTSWFLSGEFSIERVVKGLPDDYYNAAMGKERYGWMYGSNSSNVGNYAYQTTASPTNQTMTNDYNFLQGMINNDPEPDLFHFSSPRFSGTFIFSNTGSVIRLSPYNELKIDFVKQPLGLITSFTITDDAGWKFVYDIVETTKRKSNKINSTDIDPDLLSVDYHRYVNGVWYKNAWKLSKIINPDDKVVADVSYISKDNTSVDDKSFFIKNSTTADYIHKKLYSINEDVTQQLLSSWNTEKQIVYYSYTSSTQNSPTRRGYYLANLIVNHKNENESHFIKKVAFNYKNLATTTSCGTAWNDFRRKFLYELVFTDACDAVKDYQFTYNNVNFANLTTDLPPAGSFSQDIWGFSRNMNTCNDPYFSVYVYASAANQYQKISYFPVSGLSLTTSLPGRAPMNGEGTSTSGMLSGITTPGKSKNLYVWQSHEFYNPIINNTTLGGGLRLKSYSLKEYDGDKSTNTTTKEFEYVLSNSATSGKIMYMPAMHLLSDMHRDPLTSVVTPSTGMSSLTEAEKWKRLLVRTNTDLNQNANLHPNNVYYSQVTEFTAGNGKVVHYFNITGAYCESNSGDFSKSFMKIAKLNSTSPSSTGLFNLRGEHKMLSGPDSYFKHGRVLKAKEEVYKQDDFINPLKRISYTYTDFQNAADQIKGVYFQRIPYGVGSGGVLNYYYVYSDYVSHTNKTKVLSSIISEEKASGSNNTYLSSTTSYAYNSTYLMPNSVQSTNSDGKVYKVNTKYVRDFSQACTGGNVRAVALGNMHSKRIWAIPVETVSSVIESGTEKVVSASLNWFEDIDASASTKFRLVETESLTPLSPITNFTNVSISGTTNCSFVGKNAGYKSSGLYYYDENGLLQTSKPFLGAESSIVLNDKSGLTLLSASNMELDECTYTPVEYTTNRSLYLTDGTPLNNYQNDAGLYGTKALKLDYSFNKTLKAQLVKRGKTSYKLSFFIKAYAYYPVVVRIKNTSNVLLKQETISYTVVSSNEWVKVDKVISLTTVPDGAFNVEITLGGTRHGSIPTYLDEILFYPEDAYVSTFGYQEPYGKVFEKNILDQYARTEYDLLGRPILSYDFLGNIRSQYTYTDLLIDNSGQMPWSIEPPSNVYENDPTDFVATISCLEYESITWKVYLTGYPTNAITVNGGDILTHTFPYIGNYTIEAILEVKETPGATQTIQVVKSISFDVIWKPLVAEICVHGATEVDHCAIEPVSFQTCDASPINGKVSTTFKLSTLSGCSGGSYTYQWFKRPMGSLETWVQVGTASTLTVTNNQPSYEVYCKVSSSCGRVGETLVKSVYLYQNGICVE